MAARAAAVAAEASSWAFVGEPSAMARRVDGEAARVNFAAPEPGMWGSPLGWSDRCWALAE